MGQPKREMISKSESSPISQKRQQKFVLRRILKAFPLSLTKKSDGGETKRGHVRRWEAPPIQKVVYEKRNKVFFFHCVLHIWKSDQHNHHLVSEEEKHNFASFMSNSRSNQAVLVMITECTWKFSLSEFIYGGLIDNLIQNFTEWHLKVNLDLIKRN